MAERRNHRLLDETVTTVEAAMRSAPGSKIALVVDRRRVAKRRRRFPKRYPELKRGARSASSLQSKCLVLFGELVGIRTRDPMIKSHVLYQLSYEPSPDRTLGPQSGCL